MCLCRNKQNRDLEAIQIKFSAGFRFPKSDCNKASNALLSEDRNIITRSFHDHLTLDLFRIVLSEHFNGYDYVLIISRKALNNVFISN